MYNNTLKKYISINRLGSSVSSTLASKLDGPRGPWIDPRCRHRRESLLKLSDFFYKLRTMITSKSRTKIGVSKDTVEGDLTTIVQSSPQFEEFQIMELQDLPTDHMRGG